MLGGWVGKALRPRPVIVVRRRSPDWTRIDQAYWDDLITFERSIGRPEGSVRTLIETWNAAMGASFFQVRQKMKQITNANLRRLRGAKVIDVAEYRKGIDPEALYVFTDDDDWFAPNLGGRAANGRDRPARDRLALAEVLGDARSPEARRLRLHQQLRRVRPGAGRQPAWVTPVEEHFNLMVLVDAGEVRLETVEMSLAITNKHPCSTVTLEKAAAQWGPGPEDFRRWIGAAKADYAMTPDLLVAGTRWARPEIEAVRKVITAL
jgi:hypothetical protein